MKIEVTEIEPCKLSVHYEANFMEIADKRSDIQETFKKAPVPGFRQGKASMEAIKMHYRQQIDEALKRALAEDSYHNTLFEKKLRPHGAPHFNNLLLDGGKFVCEFEMFTKPQFDLIDWKSLEQPKPHSNNNVNDTTEMMLQELRVRLGQAMPFEEGDFIQIGDSAILDYEGTIDGVVVPGLVAQGEMVTVGKGQLQGFDQNILGMTLDETREFDFVAPEGGLPSLSGKTIHFKVTLTTGAKTVPCSLDDELAAKMGKKDFNELRETVAQAALSRCANSDKMLLHEAVAKRLTAEHVLNVPNWMSLSEAKYLAAQSQLNWDIMPEEDREKFLTMSEQNVKLSLVLDKIRETEPESQLTDQEVFEIIKKNLANTKTKTNLDEIIQQMNRTGYLQILFSRIRDENTLDFIVKNIKVIE